jgi:hypothetical protein
LVVVRRATNESIWTETTVVVIAEVDLRAVLTEPVAFTLTSDGGWKEEKRDKYEKLRDHMTESVWI